MAIVPWYGAAFLAVTALLGQAQTTASSSDSSGSTAVQTKPADPGDPENSTQRHPIHFRLGTVSLGLGYNRWPAYSYYSAYEPYGFYPYFGPSPWLWGPLWTGLPLDYPASDKGEVRLTAAPKTAQVFLDGAYAGTADRLKSMWLASGAYDLSISTTNRESFHQRIYVLSGKSLKITAKLIADDPAGVKEPKP
jgi:hypothetical protein